MEPDIRYFQAGATVIPTLLVAIVFTTKLFDMQELKKPKEDQNVGFLDGLMMVIIFITKSVIFAPIVLALLVVTILGERAALEAILENRPTEGCARLVKAALLSELGMLAAGILRPFVAGWVLLGRSDKRMIYLLVFAAVAVAVTVTALFVPV